MKKAALLVVLFLFLGLTTANYAQQMVSGTFTAEKGKAGYNLHEGEGSRAYTVEVVFEKPFEARPNVVIGVTKMDAVSNTNLRYEVTATAVSRDSFVLKVNTWGDAKINNISGNWFAYIAN
ncbi:MAG: H-type lectin domain-containing protein [Ignavibacteriales bacterium]|nr:H-type lectin domain-containing protein [Ignavibacteriales bacterium]MCF8305457.1 H-type lectin domain-containing protein [Ignavibacteriales bacterium]MCF8316140.1 H-type lectin domain-containing protein [Ignavibacteriales bacterium]MCF8436642.1 H-type lectin domain-containing protein [Ignavibacteriales bacterium]